MAVPISGALNMLNMAREALYGTWGSGTITGPISLYDMVNGGNTNGSGNSYPAINQNCLPNPIDGSGSYNSFSVYDDSGGVIAVYTTVALAAVTTGTIIYSDVSGSIYTTGGGFIQSPTGIPWFGGSCACPFFTSNTTTGVITAVNCACP